jgi:hypothetical protein
MAKRKDKPDVKLFELEMKGEEKGTTSGHDNDLLVLMASLYNTQSTTPQCYAARITYASSARRDQYDTCCWPEIRPPERDCDLKCGVS